VDYRLLLELLGYVASVLVAVSLMMSSILKLRIINLIGALCFTAYGLLIGAYPVAAVNFVITLINIYYLYQIFATKEYFTLLEVQHDSKYLQSFLRFYATEIKKFLPAFTYTPSDQLLLLFILRDMVPAGLFIAEPRPDGSLWIHLDFVIPGYRDFKIGQFLYGEKADFLRQKGFHRVYSVSGSKPHANYLRRMGFTPDSADKSGLIYSRQIG
jgi:hypothetical protein